LESSLACAYTTPAWLLSKSYGNLRMRLPSE
jgi:hypothetical protein